MKKGHLSINGGVLRGRRVFGLQVNSNLPYAHIVLMATGDAGPG